MELGSDLDVRVDVWPEPASCVSCVGDFTVNKQIGWKNLGDEHNKYDEKIRKTADKCEVYAAKFCDPSYAPVGGEDGP